jgi:hypothetical protein
MTLLFEAFRDPHHDEGLTAYSQPPASRSSESIIHTGKSIMDKSCPS